MASPVVEAITTSGMNATAAIGAVMRCSVPRRRGLISASTCSSSSMTGIPGG